MMFRFANRSIARFCYQQNIHRSNLPLVLGKRNEMTIREKCHTAWPVAPGSRLVT
jgi:hypothetical protein